MTEFLFTNNANTTLAQSISPTATVINVASGEGSLFPSPSAGQVFTITLIDAATGNTREICYCTSRSSDQLTVTRGQEGTTAVSWLAGDTAANLITAGAMENYDTLIANVSPGRLLATYVYTSNAVYPLNTDAKWIKIRACGGGGSGGGAAANNSTTVTACSGGGGGSYVEAMYPASALSSNTNITIGTGGASTNTNGNDGGATLFGSLIYAPGGGGGGSSTGSTTSAVVFSGQGAASIKPTVAGSPIYSISMGGQAGLVGFAFSGVPISGQGGMSHLGRGGNNTTAGNGGSGAGYGGGGSGAGSAASSAALTGGAGLPGIVIVEEYSS